MDNNRFYISVWVNKWTKEQLDKLARRHSSSRSAALRYALKEFFRRYEQEAGDGAGEAASGGRD